MGTVPRSSVPSVASQMQGLPVKDKTEKGLMVRVGVLIDAIVDAQRGLANSGQGNRRADINNLKKPKPVTGRTENLFNAASVNLDPSTSSANLSHQEVQVDTDPGFSNPVEKKVFANNTTFKGLLESSVYNVRARLVTKDGQISPWALLDPVVTTSSTSTADLDGDSLNATAESKSFTISTAAQEFFCATALGFREITATSTVSGTPTTAAATQTKIKDRINIDGAGYVDVEEITLPGVAGSNMVFTTSGEFELTVKRNNPLIFFTLITPAVVTFPATATLDVQIAEGAGAYSASTEDTVWVEF